MTDFAVVVERLADAGLPDPPALAAGLADGEGEEEVAEDETIAAQIGARAVPLVVAGRRIVLQGAQEPAVYALVPRPRDRDGAARLRPRHLRRAVSIPAKTAAQSHAARTPRAAHGYRCRPMAKDTEKLIRQLSLISYLMAERRPVTALEIRRDVEGYSGMNEDAFARRFYADRAELDALGINLTVDKPADGAAEQENYSLRPENFHLPAIAFTDEELASLQFALSLLDGEFAYAEPLRLALQQISWGRPSPLAVARPELARARHHRLRRRPRPLAAPGEGRDRDLPPEDDHLRVLHDGARQTGARKVDPYHLLFRSGQFYLLGWSHEREAIRVFRLSRMRGKVAYATKAEHDFKRPDDFDPRSYATRADWQFGDDAGHRRDRRRRAPRLAGRAPLRPLRRDPPRRATATSSSPRRTRPSRQVISFVLGLGDHAHVAGPDELVAEAEERIALIEERHEGELELAKPVAARPAPRRPSARTTTRAAATPRSGPSASRGSSRSRRS